MQTQPLRFPAHQYDRPLMLRDLGPGVHPVAHQVEVAKVGAMLLAAEMKQRGKLPLPHERVGAFILTCGVHDMGENTAPSVKRLVGRVVGDIRRGEKTDEDRATEAAVRELVWGNSVLRELSPGIRSYAERIITHQSDEPDHALFEVAHAISECSVGLHAFAAVRRHTSRGTRTPDELAQLHALAVEATGNTLPAIEAATSQFALAGTFLQRAVALAAAS